MIILAIIIAILASMVAGFCFMEISFYCKSTFGAAVFNILSFLFILLSGILVAALCVYVGFILFGGIKE